MTTAFTVIVLDTLPAVLSFDEMFEEVETAAQACVLAPMSHDVAWTLAEYVDLVDAGFGTSACTLYRQSMRRLSMYVAEHLWDLSARSRFAQSSVLSGLVDALFGLQLAEVDDRSLLTA